MKAVRQHVMLVLLVCLPLASAAQPDNLRSRPCAFFEKQLARDDLAPAVAGVYAEAWLRRAKGTNDYPQQLQAWKALVYLAPPAARLKLADSMVAAAYSSGAKDLLAAALLTKGTLFYSVKKLKPALDCFIHADEILPSGLDPYLENKLRFHIANIKLCIGHFGQAIPMLEQAASFYAAEQDTVPLMSVLHALALSYSRVERFGEATGAMRRGAALAKSVDDESAIAHFLQLEGTILCLEGKYHEAIRKLSDGLPRLVASRDFANEMMASYFLGRALWSQGRHAEAIRWFIAVDRIAGRHDYIKPEVLDGYVKLIEHYRAVDDRENEIRYTDRLLAAHAKLKEEFRELSVTLLDGFDTASLKRAKRDAEAALQSEAVWRRTWKTGAGGALAIAAGLTVYNIRLRRKYRRKFREAMQPPQKQKKVPPPDTLDINPEIVKSVLKHLDSFERKQKFLDSDLKQERLAVMFRSNYKYVSRIIQHYKGKSSADYINDLRIDFLVEKLKTDPKMRHYTNIALGEECGFATTQHFVNAFRKRMEMPVSVFLMELRKESSGN